MSNLKKILALALVFAIAFTMAAGAAYPTGGYLDKDDISAATLDSIIYLADLGIMSGAPASTENEETGAVTQGFKFMPTETLTRAQFCRMVYSIETGRDNADLYKTAVKTGFTDVPSGEWYAGFVNYAWLMGWVSGKSATRFDPNGELKLSEAVTLVLAYLGYDKADLAKAWPSNALMYGSIKGLFNNGVETSGAVSAPIARQWAAVLITNTLDSTFVTKNDAGRYVNASATTVKEARLGSFKTVEGIIVANNRFGIDGESKTDNANKFKVKSGTTVTNFSKQFAPIDGIMFTETQDVANAINLGDAYLGAKVKILYRETAKGNVIITYTVDGKVKTGTVAKADIKFDSNKVTLGKDGAVAKEKEYTGTALNTVVFLINGTKYSGADLGIGTGANLKSFVDKFPATTTFVFTALDGELKTAVITYLTFDKVEAVTVEEYAKQTPNEFGANVTVIKIGGKEYKRADGKIVNTASTDQGSAANKATLIAKDEYALFWVDAVTGNITVNKVAKAEAKVDYVVEGDAASRILSISGKAIKKGNIISNDNVDIDLRAVVYKTNAAGLYVDAAGVVLADQDDVTLRVVETANEVNIKLSLIASDKNGRSIYDAAVAGHANKDAYTYISGDVVYAIGLKEVKTSSGIFFATKAVEKRALGIKNSDNADLFTYVLTGYVDGAEKTYTVEKVINNVGLNGIDANQAYKLAFSDGVVTGVETVDVVKGNGTIAAALPAGADATKFVYDDTTKTLTEKTGAGAGDVNIYLLSGAKVYGYKLDGTTYKVDSGVKFNTADKNVDFIATAVPGSTTVFLITEVYIQQ